MPTQTGFQIPLVVTPIGSHNEILHQNSIPWLQLDRITGSDSYAYTAEPLYTISGFWQEKFRSVTDQIWLTSYMFPALESTITGIEVRVGSRRESRVQDLTIQLTLNGELIGNNYENPHSGDFQIYGGPDDMWGTSLTSADILNPTFGVVLCYQSNEFTPHNDIMYVNQVAINIWYD